MASISREKITETPPPSGDAPPRPHWTTDFCDDLRVTYDCSRKDFHSAYVPKPKSDKAVCCDDLVLLLNLFQMTDENHPRAANDPIMAVMKGISKTPIRITRDQITNANGKALDFNTAFEMVLLAKANPAMAGEKLRLEGSAHEIKMLTLACERIGLAMENPAHINNHERADQAIIGDCNATWEKFLKKAHKQADKNRNARIKDVKKKIIDTSGMSDDARTTLASKGVDPALYVRAKQKTWDDQEISSGKLCSEFSIASTKAEAMIDAMKHDGYVFKDTDSKLKPCIDQNCCWAPDKS